MELSTAGLLVVIVAFGVIIEIVLARRLLRIMRDPRRDGDPGQGGRRSLGVAEPTSLDTPQPTSQGEIGMRAVGLAETWAPAEAEARSPGAAAAAPTKGEPPVIAPAISARGETVSGVPEIVIIGAYQPRTVAEPRPPTTGARPVGVAPLETPASSAEAGVAAGPTGGILSDPAAQLELDWRWQLAQPEAPHPDAG